MIRLTELVEALVDTFDKSRDADPRVIVRVYNPDRTVSDRELELVGLADDGRAVLLYVPLPAQDAGELGAGDVVDESELELDADFLLDVALGVAGCDCREGVCRTNGRHPACRDRLAAELRARQRGESA